VVNPGDCPATHFLDHELLRADRLGYPSTPAQQGSAGRPRASRERTRCAVDHVIGELEVIEPALKRLCKQIDAATSSVGLL
jgi:hypothetical protein